MKLILKDNTEITVTRMNNTYAYENFVDGMGYDMNKNVSASFTIFDSDKSFEELKTILSGENREGFRLAYGVTEKDLPGMKIESISEDIANDRSIITISMNGTKVKETTANSSTDTEKDTNKEV